jgi:hypothetical protein
MSAWQIRFGVGGMGKNSHTNHKMIAMMASLDASMANAITLMIKVSREQQNKVPA